MRKITSFLLMLLFCASAANAQAVIGDKTYKVDTLLQKTIGPGIVHTVVRIPEYPLNVYLLEVDMTNPYNRVETTQAVNQLGKTETLVNAYNRHKSYGKKPIAACNASFWCVSSQKPWYDFMPGVPHGAEVVNDTIYVNTNRNGIYDFNGGSVNTASTIIDKNKKVHVGRHEWYGCVKSSKFSADQEILQVNKCCDYNQLVLFNHARGRNNTFFTYPTGCTYVFLKLKAGESWKIAKDIKFEVAEIKASADNQTLGNYDACLIADGAYKNEMAKLAVGDEVAINTYWFNIDGDRTPIEVENMTEGEAHVMLNGQITNRATADYGSKVYSRTAYGSNADGTKLYMLVIDMVPHPEYGTSSGCTATVMCQLWKSLVPDLWNVANMDAGGSAQMLIEGAIANQTNEASPRAVANGMMLFSTAPEANNDVIAALRFAEPHHRQSVMASYSPRVMGYNAYGELISEDVEVTYTCSSNVGAPNAEGSAIDLGTTPCLGTITAHYNGVEVTAPLYVEAADADIAIRIKPYIVIDKVREYELEVSTTYNGELVVCDPARFTWTIEDESVAVVENCVLRAVSEGVTKLKCELGDFSDETEVRVEVAKESKTDISWDGWTVTGTNLTEGSTPQVSSEGVVSFNISSGSNVSVSLEKEIVLFSLPEHLWIDFISTTPISKLEADIRSHVNEDASEQNLYKYPEESWFKKNTKYTVDLMSGFGDLSQMYLYPVIIRSLNFTAYPKGYVKGDNTITINEFYAEYDNVEASGVERVTGSDFNIKANGNLVVMSGEAEKVTVYNVMGAKVAEAGNVSQLSTNLGGGFYIVEAEVSGKTYTQKLIIK